MSDKELTSGPEQASETVGTGNDERLALLSAIADQADAAREEDLANVNDDGSTEPYKVERTAEPEAEAEAPAAEPAPAPEPEPEAKKYRLKVNGRELELTEQELIERAQKIEAADEYLRQAAEAKRRAAEVPALPAGPTPEELQRLQDEEDRALVRAIQMGTEEEAAAALRKLRTQANAERPSFTQDDVSRVIDERLEFNRAIEKFRTEYTDIETDPFLKKLALDRDAELLAQGDRRTYWERYDEIGREIRSWKERLVPAARPDQPTFQEKEQRKAAAPKAPVVASAKTKPPAPADDEDETPSAVIASMAKSRGGPQWMRS